MISVNGTGLGRIARPLPEYGSASLTMLRNARKMFAAYLSLCGIAGVLIWLATGASAGSMGSFASHAPISVFIMEKGVYEAETIASATKKQATGLQHIVRNPRLVTSTATIPGRIGVRFGVRYVVGGPTETNVELKLIIRFPDAGLFNPDTGARYFESEHSLIVATGASRYWEYHLENDWEIVPGVWQFEFWSNGGKLAVEKFCVVDATRPPETASERKCSQILMGFRIRDSGNQRVEP